MDEKSDNCCIADTSPLDRWKFTFRSAKANNGNIEAKYYN